MFLITDSFGTEQFAWTRKGALEWLAVCSSEAVVTCWVTGRVVMARTVVAASVLEVTPEVRSLLAALASPIGAMSVSQCEQVSKLKWPELPRE